VVLSAPTLDRDGEVVDGGCFDPLPDHITFDIDHGLSTATTVGSGKPFYDGDLLKVRGTFSSIPRAQEVRTLVKEGHIRTTSVAYHRPKHETKDGIPHVVKAELLNGAFVPVPANREAVVVSSKAHKAGSAIRAARSKMMVGSYEERQEEMTEALAGAYPDAWWIEVIATFDDRVVYEVHGGANDDAQFETPYTWDGDGVAFGPAAQVDVTQIATPVPAGDEKSVSTPDQDATGAGGDDDGQQHLELRAQALRLLTATVT
jgi:hypothetical protein